MSENNQLGGLTVVLPVYNEETCVRDVVDELLEVLRDSVKEPYEVLAVDDGSTDGTPAILRDLKTRHAEMRVLRLTPNSGQSAAFGVGFRAAKHGIIVTMDADGQNDPADIPRLVEALGGADVACGYRAERRDSWSKRVGSRLANRIRNAVLKEDIVDTGCSLKAFKTHLVRDVPSFDGMHRFLASFCLMKGARVAQMPVNHRPRPSGTSKYTNLGRLKKTVWDLRAVKWMKTRYRRFGTEEL